MGKVIAERTINNLTHSFAINPNNPYIFATCNDKKVCFWEVKFNQILKRKVCYLNGENPSCCAYYVKGKETELLVGTSGGSIGLISKEQHWILFKKGLLNEKRINCILVIKKGS